MKQLLFILLFPCFAIAQYQGNANQKITLGEQTTADGLVWRGRLADTANLLTNKLDTSVYIVLDTGTRAMWYYRASTTPKWTRLVDSLNNLQGQLSLTSKVTGTLPVANGGTGKSELTANKVLVGSGTDTIKSPTNLHWDNINSRLGINNTSPESRLHVKNNANAFIAKFTGGVNQDITFNIYADSDRAFASAGVATLHDFNFFTNDYDRFIVRRDGESWFLTGNSYPSDRGAYTVQVNNSGVWGAGAYVDGSDLNIKDNIENIDSSLYLINLLTPVIYNYKKEYNEDESKQIGFIAQDVYNVLADTKFPHAIVKSDGDILSMAYSSFIPLLTKAIQEQNALIKALEQRIINLENK